MHKLHVITLFYLNAINTNISSCGTMFLFSFMQVMWRAQKHLDAKRDDLILALNFHLLKGVRGSIGLVDDLSFENVLISRVHLRSYNS